MWGWSKCKKKLQISHFYQRDLIWWHCSFHCQWRSLSTINSLAIFKMRHWPLWPKWADLNVSHRAIEAIWISFDQEKFGASRSKRKGLAKEWEGGRERVGDRSLTKCPFWQDQPKSDCIVEQEWMDINQVNECIRSYIYVQQRFFLFRWLLVNCNPMNPASCGFWGLFSPL